MLSFECLFKIDFFDGLPGVGVDGSDLTLRSDTTSVLESSKRILVTDELLGPVTDTDVTDISGDDFQDSLSPKEWRCCEETGWYLLNADSVAEIADCGNEK